MSHNLKSLTQKTKEGLEDSPLNLRILIDIAHFFENVKISSEIKPPSTVLNYGFLTTETNLKALYIFRCLFTTSSVKLFVVTVQIFCLQILFTFVFFGKREKNTHETFHILKMETVLPVEAELYVFSFGDGGDGVSDGDVTHELLHKDLGAKYLVFFLLSFPQNERKIYQFLLSLYIF